MIIYLISYDEKCVRYDKNTIKKTLKKKNSRIKIDDRDF